MTKYLASTCWFLKFFTRQPEILKNNEIDIFLWRRLINYWIGGQIYQIKILNKWISGQVKRRNKWNSTFLWIVYNLIIFHRNLNFATKNIYWHIIFHSSSITNTFISLYIGPLEETNPPHNFLANIYSESPLFSQHWNLK